MQQLLVDHDFKNLVVKKQNFKFSACELHGVFLMLLSCYLIAIN